MNFNKRTIINYSLIAVGILLLIFSPLFLILNFLALLFLGIGIIMFATMLHKNFRIYKNSLFKEKEELIMELSVEEDSEKYVYGNETTHNRLNKKIKAELRSKRFNVLVAYFIGIFLVYLAVDVLYTIIIN